MLNGAMVIGLPLAPFNRVRKMMIEYFRHKFGDEGEFLCYTLPAINRSLQALGRVLRTPEDRGVLVLGEKRFLEITGTYCTPDLDPGGDDRVRHSTVPGVDFTMEIIGGSMPVRALVCPCMVEWYNRSPGQVCNNGYTREKCRI